LFFTIIARPFGTPGLISTAGIPISSYNNVHAYCEPHCAVCGRHAY
jgi:hypothetical protein